MKLQTLVSTVLKTKPAQSSTLASHEKVYVESAYFEISNYRLEGDHYKVTLNPFIEGFSTVYVFAEHCRIAHDISKAIELIKRFEGCELKAYVCPSGIPTIGYGQTEGVRMGMQITKEEAERMLSSDLKFRSTQLFRLLKVPVTDNQFSALLSFVYNVGLGAFEQSTLLKLLNRSEYNLAAEQFNVWVRGNGQILPGLVTRRAAEKSLFLSK